MELSDAMGAGARKDACRVLMALVLTLGWLSFSGLRAQEVGDTLNAARKVDDNARTSQAKINGLADQTTELASQYSVISKQIDGLVVYNTLLQRQLDNQKLEMASLQHSITQVSVVERQIMPLMQKMVDSLGQFVELDVPFLLTERRKRVAFLKTLLERSDITVAEKLRRILEAYEIENDYGRTIEAYKGSLELGGASREVEFLRIGRAVLLYQTADSEIYGRWDSEEGAWSSLPAAYRNQIRQGIKIARKQVAPSLLMLPIAAPETTP